MKILNIINEAKFSKTKYAYHATQKEYLQSILKHGLIPNHKDNGYGSEEQSTFGYGLEAQSGVYFTYDPIDAKYIAQSLYDDTIIVVCKIQSRQTEVDEDNLATHILNESLLMRSIRNWLNSEFANSYPSSDDKLNFSKEYYEENIINKIEAEYGDYKKYIENDIINYIYTLVDYYIKGNEGQFDESELKAHQSILLKKLKRLNNSKSLTKYNTFKIDEKITFSGANRIVGIYDWDNRVGWGDLGGFTKSAYHVYDSPQKLLNKENTK